MTDATDDSLYLSIRDFKIDDPPAVLTFADRLARECGWTQKYTERVIAEYRRFLYLCATEDVPMTPSDEVDQAWHLHLTYTRSYWIRLCGDVLPQPIHHDPTRGGPAEGAKYRMWYERTKARYAAAFGTAPPTDIWPPTDLRFAGRPQAPAVEANRRRSQPGRDTTVRATLTRLLLLTAVLAPALVITGCSSGEKGFAWLFLYVVVVIVIARALERNKGRGRSKDNDHSAGIGISVGVGVDVGDADGGNAGDAGSGGDASGCGGCGGGCGG